jgi:hypothetical protein
MNLILISACSGLALLTYWFWQVTLQRELRWKLFAIRDDLRWLAITKPELCDQQNFIRFDATLSSCARNLHCTSLWTMVASSPGPPDAAYKQFVKELTESDEICALYQRFGAVLMEHLRSRHWFIVTLATVIHPLARLIERFKATWITQGATGRNGSLAQI